MNIEQQWADVETQNILANADTQSELGDVVQDPLLTKLNKLQQAEARKVTRLAAKKPDRVMPTWKPALARQMPSRVETLVGLDDSDTPILSGGRQIRESDPQYRYDANEVLHDQDAPWYEKVWNKVTGAHAKSDFAESQQIKQAARFLNKPELAVTKQDVVDVANMQTIQKLADLSRKPGEERWIAPFIKDSTAADLSGKYAPLGIKIGIQGKGEKDIYQRELASIVNPDTLENVTRTHALDPNMNAFAPELMKDNVQPMGFIDRTLNIVKAPAALAANFVTDAANAVVEWTAGEETAKGLFGTKEERRKSINNAIGYDSRLADAEMKKIEELAAYNLSKGLAEQDKGWFDKVVERYQGGGADVLKAVNTIASNTDSGQMLDVIKASLSAPEVAVEFYGVIAMEAALGKGAGLATKAGRLAHQIGKVEKATKAGKLTAVESANKIRQLKDASGIGMLDNVVMNTAKQSPMMMLAFGQANNANEEFKENTGRSMTASEMAGATLMQYASLKLDSMADMYQLKGIPNIASAMAKAKKMLPENVYAKYAGELAGLVGRVSAGAVTEAGQEFVQGLMEELNKYDLIGEGSGLTEKQSGDIAVQSMTGALAAPGSSLIMQTPSLVASGGKFAKEKWDARKGISPSSTSTTTETAPTEGQLYETTYDTIDRTFGERTAKALDADELSMETLQGIKAVKDDLEMKVSTAAEMENPTPIDIANALADIENLRALTSDSAREDLQARKDEYMTRVGNVIQNTTSPDEIKAYGEMLRKGKLTQDEKVSLVGEMLSRFEKEYGTLTSSTDPEEHITGGAALMAAYEAMMGAETSIDMGTAESVIGESVNSDDALAKLMALADEPQVSNEELAAKYANMDEYAATGTGQTTQAEEAKTAEPKAKVKKEQEPADNMTTGTHTVGLSTRTIEKIAKLVGVNANELKQAYGSAVRNIRIKNMKSVGTESNKVQYEVYHDAEIGIMPTFARLRKAVAENNKEEAEKAAKILIKRSLQQQEALAKFELEYDAMYEELKADVEEAMAQGIPLNEILTFSLDSRTPAGSKHVIKSKDVLKDVLAELVTNGVISKEDAEANKIDSEYESSTFQIMQAQEEAIRHIAELLDSMNIVAPTIDTTKVTIEEDKVRYEAELAKAQKALDDAKSVAKPIKSRIKPLEDAVKKWQEAVDRATKAEGRKVRLGVKQNNEVLDIDEYMESTGGLKLNEVLKKDGTYVKPEKPAGSKTMQKVKAAVDKTQIGKDTEEVETAKEVNEVQKVVAKEKVAEVVKEVKQLEQEKVTETQKVKKETEEIKRVFDADVRGLENKIATELGEAETTYKEYKDTLTKLYEDITKLKNEQKQNSNLLGLLQQVRKGEKAVDEIADELTTILADKEATNSKAKTILGTLVRMYMKIKETLPVAQRVMKWIGTKVLTGKRMAKLTAEVDAMNVELETKIKALEKEISTEHKAMNKAAREVGADMNMIRAYSKSIKQLKALQKAKLRSMGDRLKELNSRIKELKSTLQNTTLTSEARQNSSGTLASTKEQNEALFKKMKEQDPNIDPTLQPLNTWDVLTLNATTLGALPLDAIVELMNEDTGNEFKKFADTMKMTMENKLNTDTKKGLDTKLYNDPAFAVAIDKDGNLNDAFVTAAAVVNADFIANGLTKLIYKTDDDLVRMLGLNNEYELTKGMKKLFRRNGSFRKVVAYSIGNAVARNMGLKPGKDMSKDHWDKLVQGLGQMTLTGISGTYIQQLETSTMGLAEYQAVMNTEDASDAEGTGSTATIPMVKAIKRSDKDMKNMLDKFRAISKELNNELDMFGSMENYHVDKPKNLKDKKYDVRGGLNDVPEKSQEVLRKLEGESFELNMPGMKVLMEMGGDRDGLLGMVKDYKSEARLLQDAKDGILSQDAYDAQMSRNREIEDAVDELLDLQEKLENGVIDNEIYFRWFFSKNGRYFIDSAGINPQTEKLFHRWLVTSKDQNRTWDMSNADDAMYFKISVVQAFDGAKAVDKDGKSISFGEGIDKANLKKVEKAYNKIMKLNDAQLLAVAKTAAHPGHAALAVAGIRAMNASKGKPFKATMLIEYDAVTSGFILKLLQTPILKDVMKWIAKGGVFEATDKRLNGEVGTADIIGGLDAAEGEMPGIVDAYKSQGHTVYANAQKAEKGSRVTMDGDKLEFNAGQVILKDKAGMPLMDENGDMKTTPRDVKGLLKAIQADGLITAIFDTDKDGMIILEPWIDENGNKVLTPKLTKFGRDLFKPGFMTFNYGSSLKSIKRMIGEVLAEQVMAKILEGAKTPELNKLIPNLDKIIAEYRVTLLTDESGAVIGIGPENAKAKTSLKGYVKGNAKVTEFQEVLQYLIAESYGEAITVAMEQEFRDLVQLNEAIIDSTKVMFRLWEKAYKEEVAKLPGLLTRESEKVIFDKLAKKFPLIKAPFSTTDKDGVAVSTDELVSHTSRKIGNTQTAIKKWDTKEQNMKLATLKVQLMTRQLAEAHAAGAVLPIHWIDGSVMAEVLGAHAGVLGVHDAIVLGKMFAETVQDMNKATGEIGRGYDMVGAIMDSLLDSIEDATDADLMMELEKTNDMIPFAIVIENMTEQYKKVKKAREDFYTKDLVIGNIAGHKNTMYTMKAMVQEDTGIIKGTANKSVDAIKSELDKIIQECSK